jgi:hypothetical protein
MRRCTGSLHLAAAACRTATVCHALQLAHKTNTGPAFFIYCFILQNPAPDFATLRHSSIACKAVPPSTDCLKRRTIPATAHRLKYESIIEVPKPSDNSQRYQQCAIIALIGTGHVYYFQAA